MINMSIPEPHLSQQMSMVDDVTEDETWIAVDSYLAHLRMACPRFDDVVVVQ